MPDILDLATSIFTCAFRSGCRVNCSPWGDLRTPNIRMFHHGREEPPNPLFGWRDAALHHTCLVMDNWLNIPKPSLLEVDARGVQAARQLVTAVCGTSSVEMTTNDMDGRNAMFVCGNEGCGIIGGTQRVHTWRSAVSADSSLNICFSSFCSN